MASTTTEVHFGNKSNKHDTDQTLFNEIIGEQDITINQNDSIENDHYVNDNRNISRDRDR